MNKIKKSLVYYIFCYYFCKVKLKNMNMQKRMPRQCPSCGEVLTIKTMQCEGCDTRIEGLYDLPLIMRLPDEDVRFVEDFVLCSGSLKEMAKTMGLSYPSVRNRLDDIIERMNNLKNR